MTADADRTSSHGKLNHRSRQAPVPVEVDLFLLAGQFPGTSAGQALRTAVRYATAAEQAGFGGVWVAEHHFLSYGGCPSAVAFAGYLLGQTSRLRVGTAACILPNRHPVALGEEAALLAEISGGRLDLGVARGGPWVDLEVFGTGLARYQYGFAEALDVLLGWLSGVDRLGAAGEYFRFRPVPVVPRPSRAVPVWVAATTPATAAVAAARGLPLLLGMHASVADNRRLLAGYAQAAADHGHDPHAVPHGSAHLAFVTDSQHEAQATLRAAMPAWLATTSQYVRIDGSPGPRRDPHRYLADLLDIHPVGPPALCVDRLAAAIQATGVRRLLLMVEGSGNPDRTVQTIDRLAAEVIPQLTVVGPADRESS